LSESLDLTDMADTSGTSRSSAPASSEMIPERPGWLDPPAQAQPSVPTMPPRRAQRSQARVVEPAGDEQPAPPLKRRMLLWLTSAAATGYGLSFIVHGMILAIMGLWMLPIILDRTDITTVVQSDAESPEEFTDIEELTVEQPAGSEEIVQPQHTEMLLPDAEITKLQHDFLTDVTAAETKGEGGSDSGNGSGIRLLEPKNAVRKGSFSAWTIPIAQRFGEKPEAGDSPRPGQAYFIVIQVQIPEGRRTYKINDLSGKIVGTDGYQQLIPAQAFVQDKSGRLVRAQIGRLLPIIDGVVQILIQVPGAEALVKDTVSVKSRSLSEQQTLELVFGESSKEPDPN
jgi:hypothetical protein